MQTIFHAKWLENVEILKSKHFHSGMSGEWNPCLLLLMSLKFYIDDIFLKILYFFRILMIMTFNIFADDFKLFRVIVSALDCAAMQNDIDELLRWCEENGMSVNIKKCKAISFTRCRTVLEYSYKIGHTTLERVDSIRDLGVILDSKLRFNEHISTTAAKAFAILG